jgi:predicted SnoaL-like aldol condensation-catalyzing enzyme
MAPSIRIACRFVFLLLSASGQIGAAAAKPDAAPTPKEIVTAFYRLALTDFKPKEAFARYAAPGFVEHSVDSTDGTAQSTVTFLSGLVSKTPRPKWEIVRTVAEGDLVFLQVRYTPAAGAAPVAVGELFQVRNGKLIAHWDIIEHAPAHPTNPNSMF